MDWIINNLPSLGVLAIVVLFISGLVFSLVKMKRKAGGGCAGCAFAGKCSGTCKAHRVQNNK